MRYTAEEIAAALDRHPAEIDELIEVGLVTTAPGIAVLYWDQATRCWAVSERHRDVFRDLYRVDELRARIDRLRPLWGLIDRQAEAYRWPRELLGQVYALMIATSLENGPMGCNVGLAEV